MSCPVHEGPCFCRQNQDAQKLQQIASPAFQPSMCGCAGIAHSPGCRYYAIQEGERIAKAQAEVAAHDRLYRDARKGQEQIYEAPIQGTAGLEWAKVKEAEERVRAARPRSRADAAGALAQRLGILEHERTAFVLGYVLGKT